MTTRQVTAKACWTVHERHRVCERITRQGCVQYNKKVCATMQQESKIVTLVLNRLVGTPAHGVMAASGSHQHGLPK